MERIEVSRSTGRTVKLSFTEPEDYGSWVAFIAVGDQQDWGFKGLTAAELVQIRDWINGRLQELEPVNEDEEQEFTVPEDNPGNLDDKCMCGGTGGCGRTRGDVIRDSEYYRSEFIEADGTITKYKNGARVP